MNSEFSGQEKISSPSMKVVTFKLEQINNLLLNNIYQP